MKKNGHKNRSDIRYGILFLYIEINVHNGHIKHDENGPNDI